MPNLYKVYPGLYRWQALLGSQAGGFAAFFVIMAMVGLFVAWRVRHWKHDQFSSILDMRYVLLLGLVVRLPLLRESFWYDESFTAGLARLPFADMLTVIRHDVHPPLWYSLEWLIGRFSTSELAMRAISLVAGMVAIVLVQRVVARLYDARTASVAALIAATLPVMIYYSTEARPYMLIVCCVLGLLLCIMEGKAYRFALIAIPLLYLHNIAYVYVALLGLFGLWQWRRDLWLRLSWVSAGVAIVAAGSLWLPVMFHQVSDIADGFWLQFYPGMMAHTTVNMTLGWRIDDSVILLVAGAWIVGLVVCLTLYRPTQWAWLWAVAAFGVPALVALVSAVWRPVYLDRALLSSALLVGVPLAHGVVQRWGLRVMLPLILFGSGIGMYSTQTRTPFREHVAECKGDSIYVTSTAVAFLANYYRAERPVYVWRHANDLNQTLPDAAKDALGWQQRADVPDGTVCILWYRTDLSSAAEQRYIQHLGDSWRLVSAKHLAHNTLGDLYALEMIDEHQR